MAVTSPGSLEWFDFEAFEREQARSAVAKRQS